MSVSVDTNARFLKRLAGVTEISMRVVLWREYCTDNHPDRVLGFIEYILEDSVKRSAAAQAAILSLSRFLTAHTDLAQRVIVPAAVVAQNQAVLDLVLDSTPAREINPAEVRNPILDRERDVTLGERRTLARRPDRNLLSRLLSDPDPVVVRNLLKNPRILEHDVLKIASAQPVSVAVLQEVIESDRWCTRKIVQLALIQNPYTPPKTARALVELLDESGLREVHAARAIHPLVREVAKARLKQFSIPTPVPAEVIEDPWVRALLRRREDKDKLDPNGPKPD